MIHTPRENTIIAAEFEKRLTRVLEERFGATQGSLVQRAEKAALYLPADLARRLRELAVEIDNLNTARGQHAADATAIGVFRAQAEATLASLRAVTDEARGTARKSRWSGVRRHLFAWCCLTPAILIISFIAGWPVKLIIALVWILGTYLYWIGDLAITVWLRPSWLRGGLRTLIVLAFIWDILVVVLALAVWASNHLRAGRLYGPGDKRWLESQPWLVTIEQKFRGRV